MYKIEIPLYRATVELHIGDSNKTIKNAIHRYGNDAEQLVKYENSWCFTTWFQTSKYESCFIMSINPKISIEDIYHEALHMAYYVLHDARVKTNVDNHETLCYLQGYIAEKIRKIKATQKK